MVLCLINAWPTAGLFENCMSELKEHCLGGNPGFSFCLLSEAAGDCVEGYKINCKNTPTPSPSPNSFFPQTLRESLHITMIASTVLSMLIVMNTAFFSPVFLLPLYVFASPVCSLTH